MSNKISTASENAISQHLDAVEKILVREQERIETEVSELQAPFPELSETLRWRLMVLSCSLKDHNLWLRQTDSDECVLTEIETGVSVSGGSAKEACINYFMDPSAHLWPKH